jgi:hypothetical protein
MIVPLPAATTTTTRGGGPPTTTATATPIWLPIGPGEQLCNLVGRWRILQRVASHRWTTDDLVTAHVAASTFSSTRDDASSDDVRRDDKGEEGGGEERGGGAMMMGVEGRRGRRRGRRSGTWTSAPATRPCCRW